MVKVWRNFWEIQRRNQGSSRSVARQILHMEKQRGSDKVIANERTAESRIETAVGVESRAVHSSSSRDVSSHYATSSIASAMSSANSTYLSVAVPTFYLEMLYQLACSTFGSAH